MASNKNDLFKNRLARTMTIGKGRERYIAVQTAVWSKNRFLKAISTQQRIQSAFSQFFNVQTTGFKIIVFEEMLLAIQSVIIINII